jgi:hypothetical protein
VSQASNQISTISPLSGIALVGQANAALAALLTQYSGSSAPGSPSVGQSWLNTSAAPIYVLSTWDGSQWVYEGTYDTSAHQFYAPIGGGLATLASAATVNLGSVNQSYITITGTTAITSLGASAFPGQTKVLKFSGSLQLTNSAALQCPNGYNVQTTAGDTCTAVALGSSTWIIISYQGSAGRTRRETLLTASSNYTVLPNDEDVVVHRTSSPAAINITMPLAASKNGVVTHIIDTAGNAQTFNIFVLSTGGETFSGIASGIPKINTNHGSVRLRPSSTGGYVLV